MILVGVLTDTYTLTNGVKIPKVGFGTWQIPDGQVAYNAVSNALKLGYRHIDTARAYGNEASVGRAIRESDVDRSEVFVTSKLPGAIKTFDGALDEFNKTMAALDMDYLDLYLIHAPWPWDAIGSEHDKGNQEVWRAFEKIYQSGRVKAIGVSNFNVHDLDNLAKISKIAPMVDQIQYYVGFTEPKIVNRAQAQGVLIEAYSPLATGDLLHNAQIKALADKYQVSVPQLALRFCLENGVLPLPKATGEAHIKANTQLDFTISPEDMTTLNQLPDTAPEHFHNPTQG
ncbi:oxidoreductase [Agrilactobacillus composti DSM 18527 = JCM 14202]|uniref:Oxidoreductase n=1 Tax=Agrilactobacillus composti DSM 18527 = JCM 14202 TaxID=1423734 RepID=A0A0R1XJS8_9LACO|nr:oxidoreductase [Agrilactobacillus composti DSM 18527 = JCM 14202]